MLEFEQVLAEEKQCIEDSRSRRVSDGKPTQPFSLAFSGGGIRAAAFQAGVLWRLAQENRLKDVEYFTAVSGGGYITSAFASHIVAAGEPEPGRVKEYYLDVVAKTICRMQDNAGDFIRDFWAKPGWHSEGAGPCPRLCDVPILLGVTLVTLTVNPLFWTIAGLVPFANVVELFFGGVMRASLCQLTHMKEFYMQYTIYPTIIIAVKYMFFVSFLLLIVKALPCCKLVPVPGQRRPHAPNGYLTGHAASAVATRLTVGLILLSVFLGVIPFLQYVSMGDNVTEQCREYIQSKKSTGCGDDLDGTKWFELSEFAHSTGQVETKSRDDKVAADDLLSIILDHLGFRHTSILMFFFELLGAVLLLSLCCLPILGSDWLKNVIFAAGPLVVLMLTILFVRYRVYGPFGGLSLPFLGDFNLDTWNSFSTKSLICAMCVLPFYEEIRSVLHQYYKSRLVQNFFAQGKDVRFHKLKENAYCPFVIVTGTSSDFQPPGDHDTISELSFSSMHTGSEETGYVPTRNYVGLGKCTALTGAGCLDAISLSMNDALSMRFWLEVLNLSWGDYIIFESRKMEPWDTWAKKFGKFEGMASRMFHRIPSGIALIAVYAVYSHGLKQSRGGQCSDAKWWVWAGIIANIALVISSFFIFIPKLELLGLSPIMRQLHQATKYFYVGKQPPRMLYVTDGGVRDCTALVQLMRRKSERILLVLAAADPRDDLGVLKTAMGVALEEKLGSFYDPQDPRKDIQVLFDQYKKDGGKTMKVLHIGISYGWDEEDKRTGHLYIVKNRLPPDFENQAISPYITESEVKGEVERGFGSVDEAWGDRTTNQLGPFPCCDCCHIHGWNCGPKFPHGTATGYLFLSPQWCNSLVRLGYDLSGPGISEVVQPKLAEKWEQDVKKRG